MTSGGSVVMTVSRASRSARRYDFWGLPAKEIGRNWRQQWNRLLDQIRQVDSWTLFKAIEEGVPATTVLVVAKALGYPSLEILRMLGLSESTFRHKVEIGAPLPEVSGHRAVALLRVIARLGQLLADSGDKELLSHFDLESWIGAWLKEPLPELGGATPATLLRNPEGCRVVERLLDEMRGGLVA